MSLKKTLCLTLLSTLAVSTAVMAKEPAVAKKAPVATNEESFNPWMIRVRAIDVAPDGNSSLSLPGTAKASSDYTPEFDISYFFTKNIASELILATSKHNINALNGTALGSVWALPPTLTLQYHFMPDSTVRPYVGAGVNYTHFYGANEATGLNKVTYGDSFGEALQAGVDIMKDKHWGLNIDVKKIFMSTNVSVNNGAITGGVNLDPWVIGTGITYKF